MADGRLLTTADLGSLFTREMTALGGAVKDVYDDGRRLFARGVLPSAEEVRPRDKVFGGVALRSDEHTVHVHPYTFRQVCTNGSIMAHSLMSRRVDLADFVSADEAEAVVAGVVSACGAPEVFSGIAENLRTAADARVDVALSMLPWFSRFSGTLGMRYFSDVMERFFAEADETAFGLFNAVTSVARDTKDQETRWSLEEFGGGLVVAPRAPKPAPGVSTRTFVRRGAVLVS